MLLFFLNAWNEIFLKKSANYFILSKKFACNYIQNLPFFLNKLGIKNLHFLEKIDSSLDQWSRRRLWWRIRQLTRGASRSFARPWTTQRCVEGGRFTKQCAPSATAYSGSHSGISSTSSCPRRRPKPSPRSTRCLVIIITYSFF